MSAAEIVWSAWVLACGVIMGRILTDAWHTTRRWQREARETREYLRQRRMGAAADAALLSAIEHTANHDHERSA